MTQNSYISSAGTFLAKFTAPAFWILFGGLLNLSFWFGIPDGRRPPALEAKFFFLIAWILGSALVCWTNAGLKRVRLDGQQLLLSNYVREICIPISAIIDVRQNFWLKSRPITIYFGGATKFGNQATFIPKWRLRIRFWREDPVVDELRQMAGLAPGWYDG
jgi:hypothetical protein